MAHANARLTPAGRLTLVGRIAAHPRRPIAHIAHEMGVSRTTTYRWWARYQQFGQAGLVDRPSVPAHSPRRTSAELEERILRLRRRQRLGPARIAARLHLPGLHGLPGPGPLPDEPTGLAGPPHRPADPPLRAPTTRRPGPPGRQEARPHPFRRRPSRARPPRRGGQPTRRPIGRWL
jgi:transposase-like protein